MKTGLTKLSEKYLTALRKHTKPGAQAGVPSAAQLGRQAVALGLETLDLARIHELALTTLASPDSPAGARKQMIKQAKAFFLKAIAPIEQTHRPARKTDAHVQQLNRTLRRRTVESSDSARHLRRGIAQRQAAEAALKKSGKQRQQLLAESGRLQKQSRRLTHKILATQENEWQPVTPYHHHDSHANLTVVSKTKSHRNYNALIKIEKQTTDGGPGPRQFPAAKPGIPYSWHGGQFRSAGQLHGH